MVLSCFFVFIVIFWSQHLISDSIIPVLHEISNKEQIFTIWEKTSMFSGYFKAIYFIEGPFAITSDKIRQVLTREIGYVVEVAMPNEKSKTFIKMIDQFIFNKQQPEIAFIQCRYPFKLDIKLSLFGRKTLVRKMNRLLQSITNKYITQTHYIKLSSSQVSSRMQ